MKKIIITIILILICNTLYADRSAYNLKIKVYEESKKYILLHHHDWTKIIGEIKLFDKTNGMIFETKTGAFTHLAISPDEKYFLLISDIKLRNPFQIMILDLKGNQLIRNKIKCLEINQKYNCGETVTNWTKWFHELFPEIDFKKEDHSFKIEITSPNLKRMKIKIKKNGKMEIE